jgi:hypothetical protein
MQQLVGVIDPNDSIVLLKKILTPPAFRIRPVFEMVSGLHYS